MMMGVNVFSAILCAVSLIEQGTLFSSVEFALRHENFARDVFFLSLSGATGQVCDLHLLAFFSFLGGSGVEVKGVFM